MFRSLVLYYTVVYTYIYIYIYVYIYIYIYHFSYIIYSNNHAYVYMFLYILYTDMSLHNHEKSYVMIVAKVFGNISEERFAARIESKPWRRCASNVVADARGVRQSSGNVDQREDLAGLNISYPQDP